MWDAIFLACYGLIGFLALFLFAAWSKLAIQRALRFRSCRSLRKDRYLVLAASLGIHSAGMAIIFLTRVYNTLVDSTHAAMYEGWEAAYISLGMVTVVVSKYDYLWALEVNRRDKWWISGVLFGVLWILFSFWYNLWYIH